MLNNNEKIIFDADIVTTRDILKRDYTIESEEFIDENTKDHYQFVLKDSQLYSVTIEDLIRNQIRFYVTIALGSRNLEITICAWNKRRCYF